MCVSAACLLISPPDVATKSWVNSLTKTDLSKIMLDRYRVLGIYTLVSQEMYRNDRANTHQSLYVKPQWPYCITATLEKTLQ